MLLPLFILVLMCYLLYKSPQKYISIAIICYPTLLLFKLFQIPLTFYLSFILLTYYAVKKKKWKSNPFLLAMLLCLFSYIVSNFFGIEGSHLTLLINYFTDYLFVIVLWNAYKPTYEQNHLFIKILIVYVLINTTFSISETFSGENLFIRFLHDKGILDVVQGENYFRHGLYRAQGLMIYNDPYGAFCCIALFYIMYSYKNRMIKDVRLLYILISLLLFAIISTGSRSILVMSVICIIPFTSTLFKKKEFLFLIVIIVIIAIGIGATYIDAVINSFVNTDNVGGSDLEMRYWQLMTTFQLFENNPIIGNGLGYIYNAISRYGALAGGESIIFTILIDRGLLGSISTLILWGCLFAYLLKRRYYSMLFLLAAFIASKIATLVYGFNEAFIFLYLIPLMRQEEYLKSINKNK